MHKHSCFFNFNLLIFKGEKSTKLSEFINIDFTMNRLSDPFQYISVTSKYNMTKEIKSCLMFLFKITKTCSVLVLCLCKFCF